ncbi:MAG: hypothetical protein MJZ85_06670 [Bacteroidales bacterium]|nr:hypothetical protein [Bacteroidales bacterium]
MSEIPELKREYRENVRFIGRKTDYEALLTQLAEEASELAQAALKFRRALGYGTETPVRPAEACGSLLEEIADVCVCIDTLMIVDRFGDLLLILDGMTAMNDVRDRKAKRWAERIKEAAGR